MKVIQGLYSGVTTVELDTLAAEIAATLTTKHPDYAILAARIAVSNLHKETKKVFSGKSLLQVMHIASLSGSLKVAKIQPVHSFSGTDVEFASELTIALLVTEEIGT